MNQMKLDQSMNQPRVVDKKGHYIYVHVLTNHKIHCSMKLNVQKIINLKYHKKYQ